jgi:nicotinate phosphoribosyltransferase
MSDALVTDLYEVTMALSYQREGMTAPGTFSLFVRKPPPARGFLFAAGLEPALDYLGELRVDETDVAAFAEALDRPYTELEPLLDLRFTGEVRAVPEGRIVLPGEPLLEVTAPLPEAQFVESYLLNQVCHQSAVASKAARCMLAAAHAYGLRAVGTMAHSYIEAFGDEAAAFRAFARAHPGPVTFLVDTYDTAAGVAVAADVLRELGLQDGCAVRLDSGDLGALAVTARRILDGAGLPGVRITASGGLDEYGIERLVRSGAPIDVFAVGTLVGVSADAPYLDAAYKLVEYDGRPMMKLSTGKVTAPGAKQVHRGPGLTDSIALRDEPAPPGTEPLLRTVMVGGKRTSPPSTLADARAAFEADLAQLPPAARRIEFPQVPSAAVSERLSRLTADVRRRIEDRVAALSRATGGQTESAGPVAEVRGGGSTG